jgi:hypothetical protein
MIIFICKVCGDKVVEEDLRQHLIEHNPNAASMDWEDVENVFNCELKEEK